MYFRYFLSFAADLRFIPFLVLCLCSACTPGRPVSDSATRTAYTPHRLNAFRAMPEKDFRTQALSVLRTEMAMKGISIDNPMLIRAFKSEMQLELWVKSAYRDQYKLFKTYNICNKSGVLGPKLQEGDKQTPEGFYTVTPARLNPNSKYFLSFDIGFPNAYDRAHRRTGSHLMIHGSCVSEGCLAMTDENIAEIYTAIEHNFVYGHTSIPVHIYPFRMSDSNMDMRRLSHWYPFWENLKEGYDYFETHHAPARVSVREDRYVFAPHRKKAAHGSKVVYNKDNM